MTEERTSFRQIMKGTSIFGGVQVFNILISIVKSKFVAVLLGPTGMGIAGLLTSTLSVVEGLTNFGLGTSAVKNVSQANATGKKIRVATVLIVLKRLVWITGTLGAVITIIFSSWLSKLTFGNSEYTIAFIWISITLLFKQITAGQLVLLQGLRKLKYLAQANLFGSLSGLIFTVPLYYYYGIDGIVPGIILAAIISMFLSWYFSGKVEIEKVRVSRVRTIAESKDMLAMGFMISLNGILTIIAAFFLRIYINNLGGLAQVGLYTAGFTLVNTYVGMIFTAMETDYYPRLSAVNNDNGKVRVVVEQQAIIALLLLMPIIIIFLIFSPIVIKLLFSNKFVEITQMVNFAIMATYFRAVSWSIGFILFAKGESKLLIKTGIGFNTIFLINNIIGYYFFGLTGLGFSFIVNYLFHLVVMFFIAKFRYSFYFDRNFLIIFFIGLLLCSAGFSITLFSNQLLQYALGIIMICGTAVYSFYELDKRLNLKTFILKYLPKYIK